MIKALRSRPPPQQLHARTNRGGCLFRSQTSYRGTAQRRATASLGRKKNGWACTPCTQSAVATPRRSAQNYDIRTAATRICRQAAGRNYERDQFLIIHWASSVHSTSTFRTKRYVILPESSFSPIQVNLLLAWNRTSG